MHIERVILTKECVFKVTMSSDTLTHSKIGDCRGEIELIFNQCIGDMRDKIERIEHKFIGARL